MSSQKQCHRLRKFEKNMSGVVGQYVKLQRENQSLKKQIALMRSCPPRWKLKAYREWKGRVIAYDS